MNIDDVLSYVIKVLAPNPSTDLQHQFIASFLKRLRYSTDAFSTRLLICIGIDLKVYEKEFPKADELECLVNNYRKVIIQTDKITLPKTYDGKVVEPHTEFALSVKEFGLIACRPDIKAKTQATYVRVFNFDIYYDFILPQNKKSNKLIPYDIEKRHNWNRFYEDFSEYDEHRDINISILSSGTGWVFATDKKELDNDIREQNIYKILDRIGYYAGALPTDTERNKYIYLEYPELFEEEMLQPTALIGDWGRKNASGELVKGNDFFLSFKKNNDWGKTFPVTGSSLGIKERAHLKIEYPPEKAYPFKAGDLKELTKEIPKAPDPVIIKEALNRFISAS